MRSSPALIVSLVLLVVACSDPGPEASDEASSLPEAQNAPVDRDPTPDTGTGGQQQTADPAKTVK
jgi:hypothetical protein